MVFCLSALVCSLFTTNEFPGEVENRVIASRLFSILTTDWNGDCQSIIEPASFGARKIVDGWYDLTASNVNFSFRLPGTELSMAQLRTAIPIVSSTKTLADGAARARAVVTWLSGYQAVIYASAETEKDWEFKVFPAVNEIPIESLYRVTVDRGSGWIRLLYTPDKPIPILPPSLTRARSLEQTQAAATQEVFRRYQAGQLRSLYPAWTCITKVRSFTAKPNAAHGMMNESDLVRSRRGEAFLVDKYGFQDETREDAFYSVQVDAVSGRVLMIADLSGSRAQNRGPAPKFVASKPVDFKVQKLSTRHQFSNCGGTIRLTEEPATFKPDFAVTASSKDKTLAFELEANSGIAQSFANGKKIWYRLDKELIAAAKRLLRS